MNLVNVLEQVIAVKLGAAVRARVGLTAAPLVKVLHVVKDAVLGDGGEVAVGTLLGRDVLQKGFCFLIVRKLILCLVALFI